MTRPEKKKGLLPWILAGLVHLGFVAFLVVNFDWTTPTVDVAPNADVVQAVAVDESKIKVEQDKLQREEIRKRNEEIELKKRTEEEKKKLAELEKNRKAVERQTAEAKIKRDEEQRKADEVRVKREKAELAAIEESKRQKLDEKRKQEEARRAKIEKAELEKKQKEETERKQSELQERLRREALEDALKQELETEQSQLDVVRQREVARQVDIYKAAIRQHVERNWRRPPTAAPGMSCVVRVTQAPSGEVLNSQLLQCNTQDLNFKKSVEDAMVRSSPLPRPADISAFERELEFTFDPKG